MNEPEQHVHWWQKLWNKHSCMGLHSEHNNWLQMGALADSTELQYTEDKFILNKFPSHCDWCFYIWGKK